MTRKRLLGVVLFGALAVVVTACSAIVPPGRGHADLDRDPRPVGTPAPDDAGPDLLLPPSHGGARVVDPGWDALPLESGGVYLAPVVEDDRVIFTAVSEEGTVLWTAERPMLCSAFIVTASDDGPLAILMDISAGELTMSETTISAYDLNTGAKRWGPVDVPGPHVGPGLVFAAPPPESMGDGGPRRAIDPATGNTIADESEDTDSTILGESDGVVLLVDERSLVARTAEGPELWSLSSGDLGQPLDGLRTISVVQNAQDLVLLGDRAAGATLVSLTEGVIEGRGVRGGEVDLSAGIRILLGGDLQAADAAGRTLWSRSVPADATLLSAGDGSVYLSSTDRIDVFDTTSGELRSSIPSDTLVPQKISAVGAGVIDSDERPLLVAAAR